MEIGHPRAWYNRLRKKLLEGGQYQGAVIEIRVKDKRGKLHAYRIGVEQLKAVVLQFEMHQEESRDNRLIAIAAQMTIPELKRALNRLEYLVSKLYWYDKPEKSEEKDNG